ncbi:NAD(P)H-binding protein [Altererythrobacter salegens]|uniref:NAD(P)H-binding protein n=1 Tax=Croceibacterium salegens TaxID=1737568 RepID=A0A6I4SUG3_9SPHN|nr:NAD(P)H-binding protein [Croceibacterium salegens]MXO58620.1 NAD(P)H-binding protein [Croceibacterium salegens]
MSDVPRILLVGATGLVGTRVMEAAVGRSDLRLVALTRREAPMPPGARMEMMVSEPPRWDEAIALIAPEAAICALGTTWRKSGRDEAAFRQVDEELVLRVARAAVTAGVRNFVFVSSVGANPGSKALYLRVKGEVEARLRKLGFHRLDILRPGLLRGPRTSDRRIAERLGIIASPLTNLVLTGSKRQYRAIDARQVALAALQATREKARGTFLHDSDGIVRLARRLDGAS